MSNSVARPWARMEHPRRLLAIRLQALGDVAITLPYLLALHRQLPGTEIDFLTRAEYAGLPEAVHVFSDVVHLPGGRSERLQLVPAAWIGSRLRARRYDVVIDLQNNRVSRLVRRLIAPSAWSAFDRDSPQLAAERTQRTIEAAGFPLTDVTAGMPLVDEGCGVRALHAAGGDRARELVVFSPAGAFPTRNWPLSSYIAFARLWASRRPAQFAVLGLAAHGSRAAALREALGPDLIDLTGRTTLAETLGVLRRASLVVAEDGGLLHMAWVSGVPTLALFGSSRHEWSAPVGPHTECLHSGDLPCGACMAAICRYGDVHCLTRYAPEMVVEVAEALVRRAAIEPPQLTAGRESPASGPVLDSARIARRTS